MMTSDRSFMYWMSNEEWWRINREKDCFELTDKATPEAIESFNLWVEYNRLRKIKKSALNNRKRTVTK